MNTPGGTGAPPPMGVASVVDREQHSHSGLTWMVRNLGWAVVPWSQDHHADVVLVVVRAREDREIVARLVEGGVPVVVLMPQGRTHETGRYSRAGITALPIGAPQERCGLAMRVAVSGDLMVPHEGGPAPRPEALQPLSTRERRWLARLEAGVSVGLLAGEEGYSRSHFSRLMQHLYVRLRATNAVQAVANAIRAGLLD